MTDMLIRVGCTLRTALLLLSLGVAGIFAVNPDRAQSADPGYLLSHDGRSVNLLP
jgi:hypothetical protein